MPNSAGSVRAAQRALVAALALWVGLSSEAVNAQSQSITVRSGNGTGDTDPLVKFLGVPLNGEKFTSPWFAAAITGTPAYLFPPDPGWKPILSADPLAKWVSTHPSGGSLSGLYAVPFDVPSESVTFARMDVWVAADDLLGDNLNEGIFVNGEAFVGSKTSVGPHEETAFLNVDVSHLIHPGTNYLFVYAANSSGLTGTMFSATFAIDPAPIWLDLGHPLVGTAGNPVLTGVGSLHSGTPISLDLAGAKSFSPAWLVIGVSRINAPFKGGVMVPSPDFYFGLTTTFFGTSSFGGLWPSGIPSAFTIYFQWWIQDPAGPYGFAASNAVSGTTP